MTYFEHKLVSNIFFFHNRNISFQERLHRDARAVASGDCGEDKGAERKAGAEAGAGAGDSPTPAPALDEKEHFEKF